MIGDEGRWHFLSIALMEERLGVEGVDVGRAARHEKVNHAPGTRCEVKGSARAAREKTAGRPLSGPAEGGEGH